jgi:glycosyltransferase involved in cell wall biosynthesis
MIKLFLLGKGNFYERLQKMIVDLGLDDTIHMHEWVEYNEVPEFISITDLCIVPLPNIDWWRVSSPLKLMEYIACEKNILMTNMIAHTNVVGKNNKYFFVNEITAESLAEEIRKAYKCFKTNPIKYHKGGIAERKKLINIISWENRSKSFEKFLIELNSFGK